MEFEKTMGEWARYMTEEAIVEGDYDDFMLRGNF